MFEVVFECQVCCPVEGMHIDCIAEEITETAGIRAETVDKPSPVVVYVARVIISPIPLPGRDGGSEDQGTRDRPEVRIE